MMIQSRVQVRNILFITRSIEMSLLEVIVYLYSTSYTTSPKLNIQEWGYLKQMNRKREK